MLKNPLTLFILLSVGRICAMDDTYLVDTGFLPETATEQVAKDAVVKPHEKRGYKKVLDFCKKYPLRVLAGSCVGMAALYGMTKLFAGKNKTIGLIMPALIQDSQFFEEPKSIIQDSLDHSVHDPFSESSLSRRAFEGYGPSKREKVIKSVKKLFSQPIDMLDLEQVTCDTYVPVGVQLGVSPVKTYKWAKESIKGIKNSYADLFIEGSSDYSDDYSYTGDESERVIESPKVNSGSSSRIKQILPKKH